MTNVAIEMKIKEKSAGIYQNILTITANKGLYNVYYLKKVLFFNILSKNKMSEVTPK